jgi:TolB protein
LNFEYFFIKELSTETELNTQTESRRQNRKLGFVLSPGGLLVLLTVILTALTVLGWPLIQRGLSLSAAVLESTSTGFVTVTSTPIPSKNATSTATVVPVASPTLSLPLEEKSVWEGSTLIFSMQEGVNAHLFAYQPQITLDSDVMPLTRLTSGPWDDVNPAISPDGMKLAFASNRERQWDLYVMDLVSGEVVQLTDTPEYESAPSWSPDGTWLVYEAYLDTNLEIFIRQFDGSGEPIRLTNHPGADYSPTWSPKGRQIAFVSTRDGREHIWLADLDQATDERFFLLSQDSENSAGHPAWSPDGRFLVWGALDLQGIHNLYIWENGATATPPRRFSSGDWPVWSPNGDMVVTTLVTPRQTYLTAYQAGGSDILTLPPILLPGDVRGLAWMDSTIPQNFLGKYAQVTPTPLWQPELTTEPKVPNGRRNVVSLEDVQAPFPQLHDMVDESFIVLRNRLADKVGWDVLSSLENGYVPLTSALAPGMLSDWLYTGRAFALNTQPINAGWMVITREDYNQKTYWRVYLRARFQDGSQGRPLHKLPWDFEARYHGDPQSYEQGGSIAQFVPPGYWVDFTRLAEAYGWEHLPALSNWRSAYPAARFNEFVLRDGLDWQEAMLEIYPLEVLLTPTAIVPPTQTPTNTPWWYKTSTPTPTFTSIPVEETTVVPEFSSNPSSSPILTGTAISTPSP